MIFKYVAFAVSVAGLATTGLAQEGISGSDSPAAVQASTKAVQLSKVVLDTDTREVTARIKGGTWCVFASNEKLPREKKTMDYERFDNLFSSALKAKGYAVVNNSSDMFASENGQKGDILVGVTLRPATMNLCSSVNGVKGEIMVDAEWQLFDRNAGKVVATYTTNGQGLLEKFASDGYDQLINKAFTANLDTLLAKGEVRQMARGASPN
jgi:hypothetical protein